MKIITYLGFTLLSIVVQFSVLDYIQGRSQSEIRPLGINGTSQPKRLSDVMKELKKKQHALYYRTHSQLVDNTSLSSSTSNYVNSTTSYALETTTDLTTTFIDVVFEENATEESFTTDSMITSTEFENFTEITFFPKKNQTTLIPKTKPKEVTCKEIMCSCNLLVKVCDINCCCDSDCSEEEHKMFRCDNKDISEAEELCYPQLLFSQGRYATNSFESLFCIAKTNLPEKRNIHQYKQDPFAINQFLRWHTYSNPEAPEELKRKMYEYGDFVWVLKNGSLSSIDLPTSTINNYCNGRRHIKFLVNDNFKCNVKLNDLEMFHFLKTIGNQRVISMRESSLNNTTPLNCTNVHCTNWTILICNGDSCTNYNKTLHEALCNDSVCVGVALKLELNFHYYNSKITNATIKLYTQKVSTAIPFMTQEISVKFYLTNESVSHVIQLSGNPGYLTDSPIIVSFAEKNYTEKFFNISSVHANESLISHPKNIDGVCVASNASGNYAKFNSNKRIKCRYNHGGSSLVDNKADNICKKIQENINNLLGLNKKMHVSPYGNPANSKDNDWIPLQTNLMDVEPAHGAYHTSQSKLSCYNLITRISLIFTFADMSDSVTRVENKLLSATMEVVPRNVTFNAEDISTPLTIDTTFIDITKPSLYKFAEGPHLNIHLPKDFFFPFPNRANTNQYFMSLIFFCHVVLY